MDMIGFDPMKGEWKEGDWMIGWITYHDYSEGRRGRRGIIRKVSPLKSWINIQRIPDFVPRCSGCTWPIFPSWVGCQAVKHVKCRVFRQVDQAPHPANTLWTNSRCDFFDEPTHVVVSLMNQLNNRDKLQVNVPILSFTSSIPIPSLWSILTLGFFSAHPFPFSKLIGTVLEQRRVRLGLAG